MRKLSFKLVITASVLALAACEPGTGTATTGFGTSGGDTTGGDTTGGDTTGGDTTGGDTTGGDTTGGDDGAFTYGFFEIEDNPENGTLDPCDRGATKTPGADIDGAVLTDANGNVQAYLAQCDFFGEGKCEDNDSDSAASAEGEPDTMDSKEVTKFTALNGIMIRCQWRLAPGDPDSVAAIVKGDEQTVSVVEIGAGGGGVTEEYRVRLCKDQEGNCARESDFGEGEQTFSVDTSFFE